MNELFEIFAILNLIIYEYYGYILMRLKVMSYFVGFKNNNLFFGNKNLLFWL